LLNPNWKSHANGIGNELAKVAFFHFQPKALPCVNTAGWGAKKWPAFCLRGLKRNIPVEFFWEYVRFEGRIR
jgi:hypothetical protein